MNVMLDPHWKGRDGVRAYQYARLKLDGTVRPVRYAGLSNVIGIISDISNGFVAVRIYSVTQSRLVQ